MCARDNGQCQLSVHGKGGKTRVVLMPAKAAGPLLALRGDAANVAPCSSRVRAATRRTSRHRTSRVTTLDNSQPRAIDPGARRRGLGSAANIAIASDAVIKFLRDHPEKRHLDAVGPVGEAFAEAFSLREIMPCHDKRVSVTDLLTLGEIAARTGKSKR
jgi:hypothetical protein